MYFKHHVIYNQINLSFITINEYFHLISTIPIVILLQISKPVASIGIVLFDISHSINIEIFTEPFKRMRRLWRLLLAVPEPHATTLVDSSFGKANSALFLTAQSLNTECIL